MRQFEKIIFFLLLKVIVLLSSHNFLQLARQMKSLLTTFAVLTLDGLEKGVKYQLKGWEMVKSENAELIVNGKRGAYQPCG